MNNVKNLVRLVLLCLSWQLATVWGGEIPDKNRTLNIGIENNRKPYAFFDDKQQEKGFLVTHIKTLCQQLGVNCHFVGGPLDVLIPALQNIRLNAVLIIDPALPPDDSALKLNHPVNIEHLKLTAPLCHISATFLHKRSTSPRKKPDDFKGKKIGVQTGSIFHSHLVSHYGKVAKIEAYPMLESAVVDVVFERLDAVLGDEAFFKARVYDPLLDKFANLTTTPMGTLDLASTSVALAIREPDTGLLKQWDSLLTKNNTTCTDLLATTSVKSDRK